MNVIDLRDELYKRCIDIIEIDDEGVYYAEELRSGEEIRLYLYFYDADEDEERVLSFFTLDDPDCTRHYYACGESIIILFEDESSSAWIIKINKHTGAELCRKKISLIGRFYECVVIDENDIIIYTKADEENRALFDRCLEATESDTIANLYDLEKGYRYFIKDFKTAALLKNGALSFTTAKGEEKLLFADPYCAEDEKEELVRTLAGQLEPGSQKLRDNIWLISKNKMLGALKNGSEKLPLRRAASAGPEGTVRFECVSGGSMIFRAKVYKSGLEQFFAMSEANGSVTPICTVRPKKEGSYYFTDIGSGSIFYLTRRDGRVRIEGEIGSDADMSYPEKAGSVISCIDERYIIAKKDRETPTTSIYDSRLHITDTFEARAKVKGETVVLY